MDYSLRLEDLVGLARILDREGLVDYFNIWHGIVPSPRQGRAHWPSHYYGPGAFTYLPAAVKAVVTRPVVGTGRMDSPAVAERLLAEGKADIAGMAKTLIADPHFPNKARQGRVAKISAPASPAPSPASDMSISGSASAASTTRSRAGRRTGPNSRRPRRGNGSSSSAGARRAWRPRAWRARGAIKSS